MDYIDSIIDQEDSIRAEIAATQPLIDVPHPLTALQSIYQSTTQSNNQQNSQFLRKIEQLTHVYIAIRFVRGDGNCFYRAYLFALCEWAINSQSAAVNQAEIDRVYEAFKQSIDRFDEVGLYSRMVTEDFYDLTLELISWAFGKSTDSSLTQVNTQTIEQTIKQLEEKLNDESTAQWYMTYLRCLTSLQLQSHADDYTPFLTSHSDMKSFCKMEVDSVNCETDAVQILALTREIGVATKIVYLDRSEGDLNGYVMPEGETPRFILIYRPGHYDILYPKSE